MNRQVLKGMLGCVASLAMLLLLTAPVMAQTASTGAVQGTITDPSNAAIPGAKITLANPATGAVYSAQSGAHGGYTLPSVTPGTYLMTVNAAGFKAYKLGSLAVTVNKASLLNVRMQVGTASQEVTVTADSLQLQTASAAVGNTITSQSLMLLPTLHRDATELMNYQPATVASGPQTSVAGAVDDQNTITLDGIDITAMDPSNVDNTTDIPVPVNSVQEFRVGVSNNNTSMDTGSGGQVTLIGRSGTNSYHGSAYGDLEDQALNANPWNDNHTPSRVGTTLLPSTPRSPTEDKRFGVTVGGPIVKNKTFFFINYEGRRFSQTVDTHSRVPTDSMKQGILKFADPSGNMDSYNLAAMDPRGIGVSPTMAALFKLYPEPNDFAEGDGVNYAGYDAVVATPETADYYTGRIDQVLTPNWQANVDYAYSRDISVSNGLGGLGAQLDIINGADTELRQTPRRHDLISASLTGQITPTLINAVHFGFVRLRTRRQPAVPSEWAQIEALPGTQVSTGYEALFQSSLLSGPIGNAPFQKETARSTQLADSLDSIHGSHSFEFGGSLNHLNAVEVRNNQLGASSSIQATAYADNFLRLTSADQPTPCSATVTSSCLPSSDLSHWNSLYSSSLGMIDNIGVMYTRDSSLNAYPLGSNLNDNNTSDTIYLYGQDTWKISPALTATYGLAWGKQTVPEEVKGRQMVMIDTASGQPVSAIGYMGAKLAAAEAGQFYNPTFGFVPEQDSPNKSLFSNDPGYWAPRVGLAWNPDFHSGLLGMLLGNQKSVLRGGFGLSYDRTNSVHTTTTPALGYGFADTPTIITPPCNTSGTPGTGCNSSSTDAALSDFRVGVDGTMPVPTVASSAASPRVPGQDLSTLATFQLDPDNVIGYSYTADLNLERQLGNGLILSLGWIGHYGRDLPQGLDLTEAPYMFKDTKSGQTFAQAYDAVAQALNAGTAVPDEAWFDNMIPTQSGVSGSAYMASNFASYFQNGETREIFNEIDSLRLAAKEPTFENQQIDVVNMGTHEGLSNYNALTATLRKQAANGLSFAINYTWANQLDDQVFDQNNSGYYSNSYYINENYGAGVFDVHNALSSTFVYQLPFGHGASGWAARLLQGWYTSGVVTAQQGFPTTVGMSGTVFGSSDILAGGPAAIPTVAPSSMGAGVHHITTVSSNGTVTDANGTGLNMFAYPSAVYGSFRNINLSTDTNTGAANPLYGLPLVNLDFALGKRTQINERYSISYSAQAFNLLNNVNFETPGLALGSPTNFGAITNQLVPTNRQQGSRWIEMELRLDF
ncbi:MAG: carboxypeptidase regulatory-like domain-containing protein [Terriglobales bacterium]